MGRVQDLEKEILRHRDLYYNQSNPEIEDHEYDRLESELRSLDPDSEVLQKTGAELLNSEWSKAEHSFFVGSLSKARNLDELEAWVNNFPSGTPLHFSEKLDGSSIVLYYERGIPIRAVTRGNGTQGEDILVNVQRMKNYPGVLDGFSGSLRGEITLLHSDFREHFEDKVSPRNAANGAAKELEGSKASHLTLKFYGVREEGKPIASIQEQFLWMRYRRIETANSYPMNSFEDFEAGYEGICRTRSELGYDIDGVVVWLDQPAAEEVYGVSSDNLPLAAIALKFPLEEKIGTIKDIRWDLGLGGRLTPVAVLEESLFLAGANITHVSLHNLDFIYEHEVHVGARIGVVRSGEVIPYMTRMESTLQTTLNPFWRPEAMNYRTATACPDRFSEAMDRINLESINFPRVCPECGGGTEVQDAYVFCVYKQCPGYKRGKILKWIQALGLKNIGEGLVKALVDAKKASTPADLYTLTVEDVESVDRRSSKHFEKIRKSLESNMELKLVDFMAGLGIPYAGKKAWTNIQATGVTTFEQVECLGWEDIARAERMGEKRAKDIYRDLLEALEVARRILAAGVKIKRPVEGGKLSGRSFCITGTLTLDIGGKKATKKVLGAIIEENGGRLESGVGKNLDYLIMADPASTSAKAEKARKYGTRLLSPQDFLNLLV